MKNSGLWVVAIRNMVSLICWTILAVHFEKWWLTFFAILFWCTYEKTETRKYTSDEQNRWISCSERLPEEKENPITNDYYTYPVVVQQEETFDIKYYSFGDGHWWHGSSNMDEKVTHWMDIKLYQGGGNGH